MPIVVVGFVGGAIVAGGIIMHNDYSDWSQHSDYSDAHYRQQILQQQAEAARQRKEQQRIERIAQKKVEQQEAKDELNRTIDKQVNDFRKKQNVKFHNPVTVSSCRLVNFESDMAPLDQNAKAAIKDQVGNELLDEISRQRKRLQEINSVIQSINNIIHH